MPTIGGVRYPTLTIEQVITIVGEVERDMASRGGPDETLDGAVLAKALRARSPQDPRFAEGVDELIAYGALSDKPGGLRLTNLAHRLATAGEDHAGRHWVALSARHVEIIDGMSRVLLGRRLEHEDDYIPVICALVEVTREEVEPHVRPLAQIYDSFINRIGGETVGQREPATQARRADEASIAVNASALP